MIVSSKNTKESLSEGVLSSFQNIVICLRVAQNKVDGPAPALRTPRKNIFFANFDSAMGFPGVWDCHRLCCVFVFLLALSKMIGFLLKEKQIKTGHALGMFSTHARKHVILMTCRKRAEYGFREYGFKHRTQ